jgi:hypothetical protein
VRSVGEFGNEAVVVSQDVLHFRRGGRIDLPAQHIRDKLRIFCNTRDSAGIPDTEMADRAEVIASSRLPTLRSYRFRFIASCTRAASRR